MSYLVNPYMVSPSGSGFDMTGLKAYYKFDNATGNLINQATAVGSSDSNGVDFTNNSDVEQDVTGLIDKAYKYKLLDGQSVDAGASTDWEFMYNTTSGVFSFVGWVKPNSTDVTSSQIIFDNSNIENSTGTGLHVTGAAGNRKLSWFLSKSDNTDDTFPMGGNTYANTTAWRMLFISWNSSDGAVQMSVNNGTKTTGTSTISGISGASVSPMSLGSARTSPEPIYEIDSIFDEFSFWNRVLTDDEVLALWGGGSGLAL
tara:strand:- start:117 stop:890 length:774 start_codon:yes stop_codon:yes gene_type:complete